MPAKGKNQDSKGKGKGKGKDTSDAGEGAAKGKGLKAANSINVRHILVRRFLSVTFNESGWTLLFASVLLKAWHSPSSTIQPCLSDIIKSVA